MFAGLITEFHPSRTVTHPFAAETFQPGAGIDHSNVEFRDVPAGLFPPVSLPAVARVPVSAGEPLIPAVLSREGIVIPDDWWSMELPLPGSAIPGDDVLLIVEDGTGVLGTVVSLAPDDQYTGETRGLVAVPGSEAAQVASALLAGRLAVLLDG